MARSLDERDLAMQPARGKRLSSPSSEAGFGCAGSVCPYGSCRRPSRSMPYRAVDCRRAGELSGEQRLDENSCCCCDCGRTDCSRPRDRTKRWATEHVAETRDLRDPDKNSRRPGQPR
jgi:hypothetical protein